MSINSNSEENIKKYEQTENGASNLGEEEDLENEENVLGKIVLKTRSFLVAQVKRVRSIS